MKKFLSIFLVFALIATLGVAAYAVTTRSSVTVTITTNTAGTVNQNDATQAAGTENRFDIPITGTLDGSFNEDEVDANFFVYLRWAVTSDLTYTIEATDYSWTVYDTSDNHSDSADFIGPNVAGYLGDGDWSGTASIAVSMENWSNRALSVSVSYADKTAGAEGIVETIDTSAVRSFTAGAGTTWADDATPANGGIMSLGSAAAGVMYGVDPSEDNVTRGAVTLEINAEAGRPDGGKSLMDGDIDTDGVPIGTLTVTIASVNT